MDIFQSGYLSPANPDNDKVDSTCELLGIHLKFKE